MEDGGPEAVFVAGDTDEEVDEINYRSGLARAQIEGFAPGLVDHFGQKEVSSRYVVDVNELPDGGTIAPDDWRFFVQE